MCFRGLGQHLNRYLRYLLVPLRETTYYDPIEGRTWSLPSQRIGKMEWCLGTQPASYRISLLLSAKRSASFLRFVFIWRAWCRGQRVSHTMKDNNWCLGLGASREGRNVWTESGGGSTWEMVGSRRGGAGKDGQCTHESRGYSGKSIRLLEICKVVPVILLKFEVSLRLLLLSGEERCANWISWVLRIPRWSGSFLMAFLSNSFGFEASLRRRNFRKSTSWMVGVLPPPPPGRRNHKLHVMLPLGVLFLC